MRRTSPITRSALLIRFPPLRVRIIDLARSDGHHLRHVRNGKPSRGYGQKQTMRRYRRQPGDRRFTYHETWIVPGYMSDDNVPPSTMGFGCNLPQKSFPGCDLCRQPPSFQPTFPRFLPHCELIGIGLCSQFDRRLLPSHSCSRQPPCLLRAPRAVSRKSEAGYHEVFHWSTFYLWSIC